MTKPYYQDESVTIWHGNCREILPTLGPVDLVLTDPPYGINRDGVKDSFTRRAHGGRKAYEFLGWDSEIPCKEIFALMFLKSLNQIIWGGNYFTPFIPGSMGWLIWDKGQDLNQSDAELAFTSFDSALRRIVFNRVELLKDDSKHPTQKPLKLMKWCIIQADEKAKKEQQTILDPFMGSGTTLRAAKDLGRKAIGIELEEKYCEIAAKRMCQEVLQF